MAPAAISVVALMLLGGSAVDMALAQSQRHALQALADNAALNAAREFAIARKDAERIKAVATAYVSANASGPDITVLPQVDLQDFEVSVSLSAPVRTHFPGPMASMETLSVSAAAKLSGSAGNVCMIGLSDGIKNTITMNHNARLTAQSCAIYSNSTDRHSMYVSHKADIVADEIYLAGGFRGAPTESMKEPITDSPPIPDPLAGRPFPHLGDCDHRDLIVTGATNLTPGVYCGGLSVLGGAADLAPGEYIVKDGPLTVMGSGALSGEHVGFFLTGPDAKIDFAAESTISVSAPKSGDMAGLLFYADPANPTSTKEKAGTKLRGGHVIRSDDARRLVGTIYLPDDKLVIDGDTPVADLSEYTVIIAKAFELNNGPNLVIQTDYAASDIPVPAGVGPVDDAEARLIH